MQNIDDKLKLINIADANISFNYILLFHVDDYMIISYISVP